jgi:hypothetical protein
MQRNKSKTMKKKSGRVTGPVMPRYKRRQALTGRSTGSKDPGPMVVRHQEVITLVDGAVVLPTKVFTFQPGQMTWLSAIASRYEHYEILSGRVIWTSSNPTTVGGTLIMGIDYDVLDSAPPDAVSLLNGSNVVNGAIWDNLSIPIKTQNIVPKRKFNRTGFSAPTLSDSRLYDSFDLYFSSTGTPAGFITIEYVVKFSTPQLLPVGSDAAESDDIVTVSGHHYPKVEIPKTAVGAGPRLREATAEELAAGGLPAGSAILETKPNWSGIVDILTTNTATNPCSGLFCNRISSLYPDLDWAPVSSALESILEDADGRAKRSYRIKTGALPGIFDIHGDNGLETPMSFLIRSATGAYSSLV